MLGVPLTDAVNAQFRPHAAATIVKLKFRCGHWIIKSSR